MTAGKILSTLLGLHRHFSNVVCTKLRGVRFRSFHRSIHSSKVRTRLDDSFQVLQRFFSSNRKVLNYEIWRFFPGIRCKIKPSKMPPLSIFVQSGSPTTIFWSKRVIFHSSLQKIRCQKSPTRWIFSNNVIFQIIFLGPRKLLRYSILDVVPRAKNLYVKNMSMSGFFQSSAPFTGFSTQILRNNLSNFFQHCLISKTFTCVEQFSY